MDGFLDITSLVAPFGDFNSRASTSTTTTRPRPASDASNYTSSTAAPPTPGTDRSGDDSSEDDDENENENDDVLEVLDSDDDDSNLPVPYIFRRRVGKDSGEYENDENENDNDESIENADDDDLDWAHVPPPAALSEIMTDDVPELLRTIVASSLESVQSQLATLLSERAAAEKAATEKAAAKARDDAAAEAKRRQEEEQSNYGEGSSGSSKGKARDTAAAHLPEPPVFLRPPPPPQLVLAAATKRSRRQMLASRLRRHVLVLGNGSASGANERGETSAAGAAAGAAPGSFASAMQRHYQMMASRSAPPGFKWVQGTRLGEGWQLVPDTPTTGWLRDGELGAVVDDTSLPTTVLDEMGTAPISAKKRTQMLLDMVRQDMEKKKEAVPPATVECVSCFEDVPNKEAVRIVCHSYCVDCFRQLVTTALQNEAQFPPKCCLNEVPRKTVLKYVPHDLARQYQAKIDEFAIPVGDRVYCPTVDCGVFVPKNQIAAAARIARCRNGHETCTACRQATHGRNNRAECPEAAAQDQRDQRLADDLAAEEGWRRCIRCAVLIEHREACQHMTCRCGAEFCYVCGAAWHTCQCGMEDLARLKDAAAERRVARGVREARAQQLAEQADRELAEVREALRQVEQFEQRENERIEQERRRQRARLQRLRRHREAALRVEVSSKYADLHDRLRALGRLQEAAARQVRRSERVAHRTEQLAERRELARRQDEERTAAMAAAAAKVRATEDFWQRDYRARLLLEMQLEEQYRSLLGAAQKAALPDYDHAMRAYQRTNDERLDVYVQWRSRELECVRYVAEEECGVRGEVLDSLRRKHRRTQRAEAAALDKKHRAQRIWCRVVRLERERLLTEMEAVEQELGLAGSTSEADANLVFLLELDAGTAGSAGSAGGAGVDENGTVSGEGATADMDYLYEVVLAAGEADQFDYEGTADDKTNGWMDGDDDSFYSIDDDENNDETSKVGLRRRTNRSQV